MIDTSIHNNSIVAYNSIKHKLGGVKLKIYNLIKAKGTLRLDQCAHLLGVEKNQISGRFTDLKNSFMIKEVGTFKQGSQPLAEYAAVISQAERNTLREAKLKELRLKIKAVEVAMCYKIPNYAKDVMVKEKISLTKKIKAL